MSRKNQSGDENKNLLLYRKKSDKTKVTAINWLAEPKFVVYNSLHLQRAVFIFIWPDRVYSRVHSTLDRQAK